MGDALDQRIQQLHDSGVLAVDMRNYIPRTFSDTAVRVRIRALGILEKEIAALGQLKAEADVVKANIDFLEKELLALRQANVLAEAKAKALVKANAELEQAKAESDTDLRQANLELVQAKKEAQAKAYELTQVNTELNKTKSELKQAKEDKAKEREANVKYKERIKTIEDANAELKEQNQKAPTHYPVMASEKGNVVQDNQVVAAPQNSRLGHFFTPFTLMLTITLIGSVCCNCNQYRQKKIIKVKLTGSTKNNDQLTRVQQANVDLEIKNGKTESERDKIQLRVTKVEAEVAKLKRTKTELVERIVALEKAKVAFEAKVITAEQARAAALSRATAAERAVEQAKEALEQIVSRAEAIVTEELARIRTATGVALVILGRAKKALELAKAKLASLERERAEALAVNGLNMIRQDNEMQEIHMLSSPRASIGVWANNESFTSDLGIIEGIGDENDQDLLGMANKQVQTLAGILQTLMACMVPLHGAIQRLERDSLEENGLREINRLYNNIESQIQAVSQYISAEHLAELREAMRKIEDLSGAIRQLIEPMPPLRDLMERDQIEQSELSALSKLIGARIECELLYSDEILCSDS